MIKRARKPQLSTHENRNYLSTNRFSDGCGLLGDLPSLGGENDGLSAGNMKFLGRQEAYA
jgi:hypothetical protein